MCRDITGKMAFTILGHRAATASTVASDSHKSLPPLREITLLDLKVAFSTRYIYLLTLSHCKAMNRMPSCLNLTYILTPVSSLLAACPR